MDKQEYIRITGNKLSKLASDVFGRQWEAGVDDEWGNHSYVINNVKDVVGVGDADRIIMFCSSENNQKLFAREVMEYLVHRHVIEPGNYIVDATW
jgi:hypothetical protein